jgi:hypothetical protein
MYCSQELLLYQQLAYREEYGTYMRLPFGELESLNPRRFETDGRAGRDERSAAE